MPADARALARLHLKEINSRISKVLETSNLTIDDTSRRSPRREPSSDRQGPRSQPRRPGAPGAPRSGDSRGVAERDRSSKPGDQLAAPREEWSSERSNREGNRDV